MGVTVNGVEIPIQVGQKWLDGEGLEWEIFAPIKPENSFIYKWHARNAEGHTRSYMDNGWFFNLLPESVCDLTRLLSGPGSEATAPATEAPAPVAAPAPTEQEVMAAIIAQLTEALHATVARLNVHVARGYGDLADQFAIEMACAAFSGEPAPTQPEVTKAALALAELASRMFEDSQSYWAGKVSDIAKSLAALSGEPQGVEKHHNPAGNRCSTCDGTYSHYHVYDERGELPSDLDGNILPRIGEPQAPTQGGDR